MTGSPPHNVHSTVQLHESYVLHANLTLSVIKLVFFNLAGSNVALRGH
jgi:hypothetical protein